MRRALSIGTLLLAAATILAAQATPSGAPSPEPVPSTPAPSKPLLAKQERVLQHPVSADPEDGMTPDQRCNIGQGPNRQRSPLDSSELGQALKMFTSQTSRIIDTNWKPLIPKIADKPFYRVGEVKVCFAILTNGQLEPNSIVVRAKSGDEALDRAAIEAVKASVFPRVPSEFEGPRIMMQINFEYNTNRHPDPTKNLPKPPNPLGPLAMTVGYTSKL